MPVLVPIPGNQLPPFIDALHLPRELPVKTQHATVRNTRTRRGMRKILLFRPSREAHRRVGAQQLRRPSPAVSASPQTQSESPAHAHIILSSVQYQGTHRKCAVECTLPIAIAELLQVLCRIPSAARCWCTQLCTCMYLRCAKEAISCSLHSLTLPGQHTAFVCH